MVRSKSKTIYICQSCGAEFSKWQGRCSQCREWDSLVETVVSAGRPKVYGQRQKLVASPKKLSSIESGFKRSKTGIFEFDRVLGGGIVPGSVVLLTGEPGIGKSTLLLQIAEQIARGGGRVLYICGEESPVQIKSRALRLGVRSENLELFAETDVDVISSQLSAVGCQLAIVDSIQTLTTGDLAGGAGGVGQVRECAERLRCIAKETDIPIILVGHITKAGGLAGPKILEHLVDAVLSLKGDRFHGFRILRSSKNRFGSCFEVGVFEMADKGLIEVSNPSALFLAERNTGVPGSVVTASVEGTRPVLVEIQALAVPSKFKYPRRTASGFSLKRLQLLAAVLDKRVGISLQDKDIYVNVASGFRVLEPAADLAVLLALASAVSDMSLDPMLCGFGEVGLGGEVRQVLGRERRVSEAVRLGFLKIVAPPSIKTVRQALSEAGISVAG